MTAKIRAWWHRLRGHEVEHRRDSPPDVEVDVWTCLTCYRKPGATWTWRTGGEL